MTISAQGVRAVYLGSGSAGPFSLVDVDAQAILFVANSEILVTKYDTDGNPTALVLNTDYTLTGAGSPTAGSLTLTDVLASGEELVIQRVTARTQVLDLIAGGFLTEATMEALFDKLIRIDQEDLDNAGLSVRMPINYVGDQIVFPEPEDGKAVGWDGAVLTNLDLTGEPGEDGEDGLSATITIGTVTTVAPGQPATVVNVGTALEAIFDFEIPQGEDGVGTGDVVGPASATDNRLAAFDGATGKLLKDSGVTIANILTEAEATAAYQPLDSDLTAIAALTTTTIGRSLLAAATAAALATIIGVGTGDSPQFTAVNVGAATDTTITRVSAGTIAVEGQSILTAATGQPLDADLTAIAALTTTAAGRSVLTITDPNADRIIAWDDSLGGITPIAATDIATEAAPASGDFLIAYVDNVLSKIDWASLPGAGGSVSVVTQVFTVSGTYTPTAGMKYAIAEGQGGGGGGGGADGNGSAITASATGVASGGGGGGEYRRGVFSAATIGASQTVTIGAAGTAGDALGSNGGAGGVATLGALMTANGGAGGTGTGSNSTSSVPRAGGAGGTGGSGGDFAVPGGNGGYGWVLQEVAAATGRVKAPGSGGDSHLGLGAQGILTIGTNDGAGIAGGNYGGGGSGATDDDATGAAGGAGAPPIMIITEFI